MSDISQRRKPRADGLRSREALLTAARSAFLAGEADIRMDALAARAGVGVGTLYRHFADREALIEAVYASERDQLVGAADDLASRRAPLDALRDWMRLFVDYAATKQAMTPAFDTVRGGAAGLYARTGAQIGEAMTRLTEAAVATGDVRPDIDPVDILRAVYGVCAIAGDRPEQARQFVEIVLKGARPDQTDTNGA